METLLIAVHGVVCFLIIILVLLQAGKGASIGATFGGGGSQTLFGPRGAATFLTKTTTIVALVFLVTSILLAQISKERSTGSVLDEVPVDTTLEEGVPQEKAPLEEAPLDKAK